MADLRNVVVNSYQHKPRRYIVFLDFILYFIVSEHMGGVRNVVLMSVYFGSGKPQGVGISGRGPDGRVREMRGSVYEQPKEEVDGSCHS